MCGVNKTSKKGMKDMKKLIKNTSGTFSWQIALAGAVMGLLLASTTHATITSDSLIGECPQLDVRFGRCEHVGGILDLVGYTEIFKTTVEKIKSPRIPLQCCQFVQK